MGQIWKQIKTDSQRIVRDLQISLQPRRPSLHAQHMEYGNEGSEHQPRGSGQLNWSHDSQEPWHAYRPAGQQGMHLQEDGRTEGYHSSLSYPHQHLTPLHGASSQVQYEEGNLQDASKSSDHRKQARKSYGYGPGGAPSFSPMTNQILKPQSGLVEASLWRAPPDQGFRSATLREKLATQYGLPQEAVQEALVFADTEDFADLYCFASCLIGGQMKDAFHQATIHSFNKSKLLESFGDATMGLDNKPLTAPQQAVKEALLKGLQEAEQAELEDADDLEEEEMDRLRDEVESLPLEEALKVLGVKGPGFGLRDIQRELFPGNGISTRTKEENIRRSAAYSVAMEVFERST